MADLTTEYMGLRLKNPLIASAFPENRRLDYAQQLQQAGVAAIVMPSLFEEALLEEEQTLARFWDEQELGHQEANSFLPVPETYHGALDCYIQDIKHLKAHLEIPVIASLNGVSNEGWIDCAQDLEQAGADALELNIYEIAADMTQSASDVEQRYVDIVTHVKQAVSIPVAVKIGSQFSSVAHFAQRLDQAGADALVLFNRFFQPDIDLSTLAVDEHLSLSTPEDSLLRIRWAAILSGQLNMPLSVTGGLFDHTQVAKAILSGAATTQICSTLLLHGMYAVPRILKELSEWMEAMEFESLSQIRGSLNQKNCPDPTAFARANYIHLLDSYSRAEGVR